MIEFEKRNDIQKLAENLFKKIGYCRSKMIECITLLPYQFRNIHGFSSPSVHQSMIKIVFDEHHLVLMLNVRKTLHFCNLDLIEDML